MSPSSPGSGPRTIFSCGCGLAFWTFSLCRVKVGRVFLFLERGFAPPGYGMLAAEDLDDLLLELEEAVEALDLMLVRGL